MSTALAIIYPLPKPPRTEVTKETVKIGDRIECDEWYRRGSTWLRVDYVAPGLPRQPRPYVSSRAGFVIGIRSVLMTNIEHVPVESPIRAFRERAIGTRESVLLVSESLYREPFIVRFQNAQLVEEQPHG